MFFEKIKELRLENNIRQVNIAKLLNIKQTTYSKYELGKIEIPIESLIKLADLYDVSLDYLLGRTNIRESFHRRTSKNTNVGEN